LKPVWNRNRVYSLNIAHFAVLKERGLEPIPKNGVWFKVEEEAKRQPEEYMKYFEDWLFASDKEIEP
jgi:hypothetical protein